jgi:hypothetical protein
MQNKSVLNGILLIAGLFSLMACTSLDSLSSPEGTAELPPGNTPTATSKITPPTPVTEDLLPDLGPAPDITNEIWLNSDIPLSLNTLADKVVLLEFWTFG